MFEDAYTTSQTGSNEIFSVQRKHGKDTAHPGRCRREGFREKERDRIGSYLPPLQTIPVQMRAHNRHLDRRLHQEAIPEEGGHGRQDLRGKNQEIEARGEDMLR